MTNDCTRRCFLKTAILGAVWGIAVIAVSSCAMLPDAWRGKQDFTFVQLCDPQLGMGGYEHDVKSFTQAVKQINALKPDFVLICGDLVNNANEKSFADFNRIKAGFAMPSHCLPGNHDIGVKPTPESLQNYRDVVGKDYYSFEHKGCAFVIVNTQLWKTPTKDESKKHDSWFETTLQTASEKGHRIFVVGHYAMFRKKPGEKEDHMNLSVAKRTELLDIFEKHGVVAVLGGHTHALTINNYKDIQLVNAETTSLNLDKRPLGFRLWHIKAARPFEVEFVPLEQF